MKKMLLAAAGAIAIAAPAAAAPVFFAGTGNYYEFIATDATWGDARAAALASNYFGRQGYLVNITTAEENAFLATLTGGSALAWTGGNDIGSEGNFYWADGPEAGVFYWMGGVGGSGIGYTNWNGGERLFRHVHAWIHRRVCGTRSRAFGMGAADPRLRRGRRGAAPQPQGSRHADLRLTPSRSAAARAR